jgi:protein-S-isoprenylcysteine O-methyltransferase Ste14
VLGSTAAALAVFALVVPAYIHRMRVEERELVSRLGEPYERYLRITRRLVPFIY